MVNIVSRTSSHSSVADATRSEIGHGKYLSWRLFAGSTLSPCGHVFRGALVLQRTHTLPIDCRSAGASFFGSSAVVEVLLVWAAATLPDTRRKKCQDQLSPCSRIQGRQF